MTKRLILLFALVTTLGLLADKLSDIQNALDSPSRITFTSASGSFTKESKYSNDHIGNWDTGKKETVYPASGSNFLRMKGGSKSASEARTGRIASTFTFTVQGAGTLSFYHRVATYLNDDMLVFYEDDIDTPLLELGGEYWCKKESYDGDVYFDLYAEDFWVEDSVDMSVDRYNHTIKVSLLSPYNGESYWDKESNEIVENCAWLDGFVWQPDNDMVICGFDTPDNVTEFDGKGLDVSIYSNYENEGKLVFEYWYTIDGSAPTRNGSKSQKYDDDEHIKLLGTLPAGSVTVRVAAYDGTTKIGEYSQVYTRKLTVGTPKIVSASQGLFEPGITLTLGCEAAETPVYYYTTNGTEPTVASEQVIGNTIQVDSPCTVKIIASAVGDVSPETLAVAVTQAEMPTYTIQVDDEPAESDTPRFAENCVITAAGADGVVRFCVDGGTPKVYEEPLTLTESATVRFATAGTVDTATGVYQLNSTSVSVTVTKLSVGTPMVTSASQGLFEPSIIFTLDCEHYGAPPVYYYTTDGKEPTMASKKADGNTIQVASPCTLKVIAVADDAQSPEALAVVITQAGKTTYTIKADGDANDNPIFAKQCVVTAKAADGNGVHYRIADGGAMVYEAPLTLTASTTVRFATAGTVDTAAGIYQLNSMPVSVTVTKESESDGSWATKQTENFSVGWNLFAVTKRLSGPRTAELIAWLHPFAYNSVTHTLEQATSLQGGAAYLVHMSMIDEAQRPATFADGGEAEPLTGDGNRWVLSSDGAQAIWDGEKWVMEVPEDSKFPGWRR